MNNLYRATITMPSNVHKKIRIQAARQNKSLSRFISDVLEKNITKKFAPNLKLGRYRFSKNKDISREKIYGDYLGKKVSS